MTWDTSTPAGTDLISQGDDIIRELKADIETALNEEGNFPGADTVNPKFKWTGKRGNTAGRPTPPTAGEIYFNTELFQMEYYSGSAWVAYDLVPLLHIDETKLAASVAGAGLSGGAGTPLSVNVDASTLEINADTLRVKDAGIVTAKLASSLAIDTLDINTLLKYKTFQLLPILQIVKADNTTAFSTTSTSFVDTGLAVTITPKRSDSKILVIAFGNGGSGVGADSYITIARGSTNLGSTQGLAAWVSNSSAPVMIMVYDAPVTTSATTYNVQIKGVGGITAFFPQSHSGLSQASIFAIEIAQ